MDICKFDHKKVILGNTIVIDVGKLHSWIVAYQITKSKHFLMTSSLQEVNQQAKNKWQLFRQFVNGHSPNCAN